MTARRTARDRQPRQKTGARKTAERYALALALTAALAAVLHSLLVLILGIAAVLGVAAFRLCRAYRHRRAGGNAAMRRRRRFQGEATFAELRRLPSQGVPIGTVRRSR